MMIMQYKLMNYLRQNHYEKWKYLTTVPGLGPGYANNFLGIAFLFSGEDLGDSEMMRMKIIIRNSLIYTLTGMMAAFITFFMLFMLYPET
jgi:hypothetical protein